MMPDSASALHTVLQRAVFLLAGLAGVALLFSVWPRTVGHLRFLGFVLAILAWMAHGLDGRNSFLYSPRLTYTGPLLQERSEHSRGTRWYEVKLLSNGEPTRWLDWLSHGHLPNHGTRVSVTVLAWAPAETMEVQVLEGPLAGYRRTTGATAAIYIFELAPAMLVLLILGVWWVGYGLSTKAAESCMREEKKVKPA